MKNNASEFPVRKDIQLTNGLRVTVFERPGTPVTMSLSSLAGSRFDPIGKAGLAHFTEHMLVSGTDLFPSKTLLAKYIERLGGEIGASTGCETLNLHISLGEPQDIEKGFIALGQAASHSLINEDVIIIERDAIFSELRVKMANQRAMAYARLHDLMYDGDPLGRMVLGTKDQLELISQTDLNEYFQKYITASNSVLIIAGGVDVESIVPLAEKYMELTIGTKILPIAPNVATLIKRIHIEKYPSSDEVSISIGFHVPSLFSNETAALDLLAELLGGGRSALLMQRLRYKEGLVYGVSSYNEPGSDCGEFVIQTSAEKESLHKVVEIVIEELNRVRNGEIPEEDFQFAKEKYVKSRLMNMETSRSWVYGHDFGLLCDKSYSVQESDERIRMVTFADIISVAKKYLDPKNIFISLAGDIDEFHLDV